MGKLAFLFAGQGAQYVGMGKELIDRSQTALSVYERGAALFDFDILNLMFFGPEDSLQQTKYTQPAILLHSLAIFEILKQDYGIIPDGVAGLSLGEYGALYAADMVSFEDVLPLVHKRGEIMEQAVQNLDSAMYAILKADETTILKACESAKNIGMVEISNYNCPGQIVIGGQKEACEQAVSYLKEQKIRSIPLKVSGPFHTRLLQDAGKNLGEVLQSISFTSPNKLFYTNVTGREFSNTSESLKENLAQQVYCAVRFEQMVEQMIADGFDTFIEIGPKATLTGFVKKISNDVKVLPTDTYEGLLAAIDEIK